MLQTTNLNKTAGSRTSNVEGGAVYDCYKYEYVLIADYASSRPTMQLAQRLDKAERAGDDEEVSKLHMRVAASGQNASTSQEEVPL